MNWKNHEGCRGQLMDDVQMKHSMYGFHILGKYSVILYLFPSESLLTSIVRYLFSSNDQLFNNCF